MPMTRTLADDVLQFRLEDERLTMTGPEPFARSGRSARTLVKDGPLRVTLSALGAGGRLTRETPGKPSSGSIQRMADFQQNVVPTFTRLAATPGGQLLVVSGGRLLGRLSGRDVARLAKVRETLTTSTTVP